MLIVPPQISTNPPPPNLPAVSAVVKFRVADTAAVYTAAGTTFFNQPLDSSRDQTYQRADALFVNGLIVAKGELSGSRDYLVPTTTGSWKNKDG